MSILKTAAGSRALRVVAVTGLVSASLVGLATSSAQAAGEPKATILPASGPTGVATQIVAITGTGFLNAAGTAVAKSVSFESATTCPTTVGATVSTTFTIVSATRIVANVPSLSLTSSKPTKYHVCVNDKLTTVSGATILGATDYTAYPVPTVTSVSPAAGMTSGGYTIAVGGTNFTGKTTATVGGVALTNIKVDKTGTAFTATVPKWTGTVGAAQDIVVNNEGGSTTSAHTGGTDAFTFANGITVSPQTGPRAGGTVLTIKGAGFSALTFGTGVTVNARVLITAGKWDSTTDGGGTPHQVMAADAVCGGVTVVSDTELVCTTPNMTATSANSVYNTIGGVGRAYTISVVGSFTSANNGTGGPSVGTVTAAPSFMTVVSSGSTFTFSDF